MDFKAIIHEFPTTPFLFIGSGITRRYFSLPDWEGLLRVFTSRISGDEFAFDSFLSKAKELADEKYKKMEPMAIVAELVERDFNKRWFDDESFRQLDAAHISFVKEHQSPFKVEVAQYLERNSITNEIYSNEIDLLTKISEKSISGIITTNFDMFLEKVMPNYRTFIGQEELIFSAIQGLAEIYKIHGSISNPRSMILTATDYQAFEDNCPYLAAKLMTIFMEYPIIFIGYSISDPNIRMILESIVRCLSTENLKRLQNRFIYVEWDEKSEIIETTPYSITIHDKTISMTKIRTRIFTPIFDELLGKKATIPVKVMRMFREEFYQYTKTSKPTARIRLAGIDDERVVDDDLVLAIGKASTLGLRGLKGLTGEEWYRNIITGDLLNEFSADDILENAYPSLMQKNNLLPVWRLISLASKEYPECIRKAPKTFNDVISNSIKKGRSTRNITRRSVKHIIEDYDIKPAMLSIAYLYDNEINVDELEQFLNQKFSDPTFYSSLNSSERSNFNRLVRIYDVLKYKQESLEGP